MKIPYGISNFKDLITGGYVYIDKTDYIAKLEEAGKYHILLRPRRFGKSLMLSALEYYYDIGSKTDFEAIFSKLYIGKHPTPLQSSYQVLFMEFSGIETGSHEQILSGFNVNVNIYLQAFLKRYGYGEKAIAGLEDCPAPADKLKHVFNVASGKKILLLVDEYDHFANTVLAEDLGLFRRITGKGGFVRSFYETVKAATQRGIVDRLFITGVTPITLDSMTSGFNIGENISFDKGFNTVTGFTKAEVAGLLQPLTETCQLNAEKLMEDVTRWYNGYRFHPNARESVYNANMVLYFLKNFDREECAYPERMLDDNIASDYGKLMGLFTIGNPDENYAVLDELINTGEVIAQQRRKFDFDKGFERDDFISLLAYMGFASLQGKTLSGEVFAIPNHVMQELYFQYFKVELERRNQITIPNRGLALAVEVLALHDNLQPLADEMQRVLQVLSNRDFTNMDEKHVKTLLLTLLYQVSFYFIQSEREMNHKYPDILLLERSPFVVQHQHLIELKYAKKSDKEKGWKAKRQEGIEQVEGYLQLPEITTLPRLSAWVLLTDGERVDVIKMQ